MYSACIILEESEKHREIVFPRVGVLSAASLPRASHGPEFDLIHFRLHSL